ncbi:hypothetical protein [Facilibium subflavum]|uniref:hypothetical protein n=1 Tax=Facilibium subflavum TaxID=2219058 RepID=UPI000E649351|nr:hypothetical protein [Facilibium subflavum]
MEKVLAILNDLFLSKAKGIEVLDLNLISCKAANKNSHDYLFSLIYNKFKIPSFSVVAYRENISLGTALISEKIKHQECRSSTEYSKFDGIDSFVEVISREFTEKIMKNSQYSSDKLQDIIKGCYAKCKFQYNMHFLDSLKNSLFDFINQHESDFYPELNNDYIRKRYLKPDSSELLSLAKALLEETIQFENTAMVYVKNVVKDREKWNGLFFDKTTYSSSKTDLSLI